MRRLVNKAAMRAFAALASLTFLPVSALHAQGSPKESPPAPAPPKDFTLPAKHEFSLPNGMRVTLVPFGRLPVATVSLSIRTGAIDEGPQQVWLANLMADYLEQGSSTHPAAAVAEAVAGMGAALNISAGDDQTTIQGDVLGDSVASFTRLIADVVEHPSFPDAEFARLRNDRLRQLAIAMTRPQTVAQARFDAQIYPDHPYRRRAQGLHIGASARFLRAERRRRPRAPLHRGPVQ
jgi:zinc protease